METRPPELKSNMEWIRWGRVDPFWAVATEPGRRRGEALAWTADEFYAAGKSDFQEFLRHWDHYGRKPGRCLEVGCGAGRMTRQLSSAFNSVLAIDISPDMIAVARSSIPAEDVEFRVTNGLQIPLADHSVGGVFSTHVLQHLDSSEIVFACFKEFARVLEPGGTMMIHVPLFDWPSQDRIGKILNVGHRILLSISGALACFKRAFGLPLMRGTSVNFRSLYPRLYALGLRDIQFIAFPTPRNGVLHTFVMARAADFEAQQKS